MFFTCFFSFFCSNYYFDQSEAIFILLIIEVSRVLAGHYIHTISGAEGWESVVNRVAKCELGEKMIVCGRAARWWDEQINDKINARRQVYKKVVNGREDLWGEYCRLRKEVKQLVIEKSLIFGMSWLRK